MPVAVAIAFERCVLEKEDRAPVKTHAQRKARGNSFFFAWQKKWWRDVFLFLESKPSCDFSLNPDVEPHGASGGLLSERARAPLKTFEMGPDDLELLARVPLQGNLAQQHALRKPCNRHRPATLRNALHPVSGALRVRWHGKGENAPKRPRRL